MTLRSRAILLLVIQFLLVGSIAIRYAYERATRPRVWVVVGQFDPNLPIRGRYLALMLLVDGCSLAKEKAYSPDTFYAASRGHHPGETSWRVRTVGMDGKLVAVDAGNVFPRSETQTIYLNSSQSCDRMSLSPAINFFIPDTAKSPFPPETGTELWAEVTVPAVGPPRPLQLALSDHGTWKPLHVN